MPNTPPLTNWAGNYTYTAARWHWPETLAELQTLVARCRRVRVAGTRHSFNGLPDCAEDLVSLERFAPVVALDAAQQTVTVSANVRYGDLGRALHGAGYALPNLASLPHISVAGACATATHGSGVRLGNLATAVTALELVTAEGELVRLSRAQDGDTFSGAVVGLGGLGVVVQLTLAVEPTFAVRQTVYEGLPLAALADHLDEVLAGGYSVSLFTDWRGPQFNQVWVKRRVTAGEAAAPTPAQWGARPAAGPLHPIAGMSPVNCTAQMGVPGPWHERLPHFRLEFTPSRGDELQAEYLVPRRHAHAALLAVAGLRDQIAPLLHVSEIRTVAADALWLSPSYGHDCLCLHFTWRHDWPAVRRLLPVIEAALAPFEARPHWGKLFTLAPARLQPLYARLPAFRRLLADFDPLGKFRNAFLETYLY